MQFLPFLAGLQNAAAKRTSVAVATASAIALLLAVVALIWDTTGGGINLLTELFGVICGTILTVAIIERRRIDREKRETDARWRSRLRDEASYNLSQMLRRQGTFALPPHRLLARDSFRIEPGDVGPGQRAGISAAQASSIILAFPLTILPERLRRDALDDAIAEGHFIRADQGELRPEPIHEVLVQLREDFDRFQLSSGAPLDPHWAANLLVGGRNARARGGDVDGYALLMALDSNDRIADLFEGYVSLLRLIEGLDATPRDVARRPLSAFGARESQNVRAERVTPSEVIELIRSDVTPVGTRVPAAAFGVDEQEQVDRLAEAFKRHFTRLGMNPDDLDEEALQRAAANARESLADVRLERIERAP